MAGARRVCRAVAARGRRRFGTPRAPRALHTRVQQRPPALSSRAAAARPLADAAAERRRRRICRTRRCAPRSVCCRCRWTGPAAASAWRGLLDDSGASVSARSWLDSSVAARKSMPASISSLSADTPTSPARLRTAAATSKSTCGSWRASNRRASAASTLLDLAQLPPRQAQVSCTQRSSPAGRSVMAAHAPLLPRRALP